MWAYENRIAWPYSWQLLPGLCTGVKRPPGEGNSRPRRLARGPEPSWGSSWGPWPDPRPTAGTPASPPHLPGSPTTDVANKTLRSCNLDSFLQTPPHAHQRITAPFSHRQTEYRFGITQQCNPSFQPSQPPVNNLPRTLKWRRRWSLANQPPDLSRGQHPDLFDQGTLKQTFPPLRAGHYIISLHTVFSLRQDTARRRNGDSGNPDAQGRAGAAGARQAHGYPRQPAAPEEGPHQVHQDTRCHGVARPTGGTSQAVERDPKGRAQGGEPMYVGDGSAAYVYRY